MTTQRESTVEFLKAEVMRLEERKKELDVAISQLKGTLGYITPQTKKTTSRDMEEVIFQRLSLEGKPMHRKDIFGYLREQNVHIAGENPLNNMAAHMSHDTRFKSFGEGMWGLAGWKRTDANAVTLRPT